MRSDFLAAQHKVPYSRNTSPAPRTPGLCRPLHVLSSIPDPHSPPCDNHSCPQPWLSVPRGHNHPSQNPCPPPRHAVTVAGVSCPWLWVGICTCSPALSHPEPCGSLSLVAFPHGQLPVLSNSRAWGEQIGEPSPAALDGPEDAPHCLSERILPCGSAKPWSQGPGFLREQEERWDEACGQERRLAL